MTTLLLGIAVAVNGIGLLLGLGYFATGAEVSGFLMLWGVVVAAIYGSVLLLIVAPVLVVRAVGIDRARITISLVAVASTFTPFGLLAITPSAEFDIHSLFVLGVFAGVGVLNWLALRVRVLPLTIELPNSSVQPTPAGGRG